jgi:hypothetical protein
MFVLPTNRMAGFDDEVKRVRVGAIRVLAMIVGAAHPETGGGTNASTSRGWQ